MVKKNIAYIGFLLLSVIFLAEVVLRIYFSFQVGPRVLLYGTSGYRNVIEAKKEQQAEKWRENYYARENRTVEIHSNVTGEYAKFFPNEKKIDIDKDTGETIEVTINGLGFRGEEFVKEKSKNTLRVITLGASSTFGFYNRDTTTYPYYLEQRLNERCGPVKKVEVYNFGIPHLISGQISTLFMNEAIAFKPDFITIYAGNNDSLIPREEKTELSFGQKVLQGFEGHFLVFRFLGFLERSNAPVSVVEFDEAYARERTEVFLHNVDMIYKTASDNGIQMIVANQQRKSGLVPRAEMKGLTYLREAGLVRKKYADKKQLTKVEASFLIHIQMMQDLESWALNNNYPFVDMIGLLDEDRNYLLSWVHLHANANAMIADAFSKSIARLACK